MRDLRKVESGYELILHGLGLDLQDPHLKGTAKRAAKAMFYELCEGLSPEMPKITVFQMDEGAEPAMIVFHDIPVKSLCAHHLLPFTGHATVGYIPSHQSRMILGASKPSRIVNHYARRPQVQERLTEQVVDYIYGLLGPSSGVGAVITANHMCMGLRGVNHPGNMVTSALRGLFTEADVKSEFMSLAMEHMKR